MRGWRVTKTLLLLFQGQPTEPGQGGGYPPDYVVPVGASYRSRGQVRLRGYTVVRLGVPAASAEQPVTAARRSVLRIDPCLAGPLARMRGGLRQRTTGKVALRGRVGCALGQIRQVAAGCPVRAAGQAVTKGGTRRISRAALPGPLDPAKLKAWRQRADEEIAAVYAFLRG